MQRFVEIGLTNAMAACVLALIVVAITRWVRAPAVRHALWVLVLFKLITPPIVAVPTGIYFHDDAPATVPVAPVAAPGRYFDAATAKAATPSNSSDVRAASIATVSLGSILFRAAPAVLQMVMWLWAASILYFAVRRLHGVVRFALCLRLARSADEDLQIEAGYIAHCLKMHQAPRVLLIPGCNNPMLWAIGPTVRLLFPSELLQRLTPEARATLLAHELAHYRRGDHWVRLLELVVDCLFWWHPVVWRARQEIEMAEEECCDAWVVSQFPGAPRRYAEALLDAVDFVHESKTPVPTLASGIGQVPFLKKRLAQIMGRSVKPRMSWGMRLVVLGLAAGFLPFRPSFARPAVVASASEPAVSVSPPPARTTPPRQVRTNRTVTQRRVRTPRVPRKQSAATDARETAIPVAQPVETSAVSGVWATIRSLRGNVSLVKNDQSQVLLRDEVSGIVTPIETSEEVVTVAFSADGRFFATGGRQRLLLWETASREIVHVFDDAAAAIQSLSFTPDGNLLVAGGSDGRVRVWDVVLQKLVGQLPGGTPRVNSIAVSPDGRLLAVGTGNWRPSASTAFSGRVTLWSLPDLTFVRALDSVDPVGAVAFRAAGTLVIGGGWDGHVTLWDVRTGAVDSTGTVSKDVISVTAFSPDSPALSEAAVELPPLPAESMRDVERFSSLQDLDRWLEENLRGMAARQATSGDAALGWILNPSPRRIGNPVHETLTAPSKRTLR